MTTAADPSGRRVDVRLEPEEAAALDRLRKEDRRSRPQEIAFLIVTEDERRRSEAQVPVDLEAHRAGEKEAA